MTVKLRNRGDITLDAFHQAAWQGKPVALDGSVLERMAKSRAAFEALLDGDENIVIYGVTSGYGQMAHLRYTREERKRHARIPPLATAASFGDPLPERVARGIVLARLANLIEGHAAISPDLGAAVAGLLDGERLPPVPWQGNGCPGEILALGHLFGPLAERFELAEKDSVSLVNGCPCATALLADAVLAARARLAVATEIFALAYEALQAPLGHLDPALDDLWGDPEEAKALSALRQWIEGGTEAAERRPYQAPVSWRILPRVLGQAGRALAQAEEAATISLRSVSDNPLVIPPDEEHPLGRVVSTGGYHNAMAYPALDALAAAWADLAILADRQVTKLLDGKVSKLPDNLRLGDEGYIGCLGFTAVAFAEQARHAAQRTFLPGGEGGGFGQNDVPVPTFQAWANEAEAGRCLDATLACLAVIASQAFHVTDRQAPPRLRPILEQIREIFPVMAEQRAPGPETGAVQAMITAKVFAGDSFRLQ